MIKKQRDRLISIAITVAFHLTAVGLLLLSHMTAAEPKSQTKVELLLVNFGTIDTPATGDLEPAAGNVQQREQIASSEAKAIPSAANPKPAKMAVNTTRHSDAPAVPNKSDAKHKAQEQARIKAERDARIREEQAQKRQAEQSRIIGQEISGAFGKGEAKASSQGSGTTPSGNQGSRGGSGSSYSLEGRSVVSNGGVLSRPTYALAIRGTIRIRITVNSAGRVTQAVIDPRGTDISDPNMRSAAIAASRNTHFNPISGGGDQRGAITYHYDVK